MLDESAHQGLTCHKLLQTDYGDVTIITLLNDMQLLTHFLNSNESTNSLGILMG